MPDCALGITKDIQSNCGTQPVGGLEVIAYVFNRNEIASITYDATDPNKITSIVMESTKRAYNILASPKGLNCGHDRVVAIGFEDTFTHYANFRQFERAAADVLNVDDMKDVCIIFEQKQKAEDGDGVYVGYGFGSGMYISTDTERANDAQGTRNIELATAEQEGESYSKYIFLDTDYATSKAALVALLTPAV